MRQVAADQAATSLQAEATAGVRRETAAAAESLVQTGQVVSREARIGPDRTVLDPFRPEIEPRAQFQTEVRDALRGRVFELLDSNGRAELVRQIFEEGDQQSSFAALAAPLGPELFAQGADQPRATPASLAEDPRPTAQPPETTQQEAALTGRDVDNRVFERTPIIPVGFFITSQATPPLTARTDAEPVTGLRPFHGVVSGNASLPSLTRPATPGTSGEESPVQTGVGTFSNAFREAMSGRNDFFTTQLVFRQVRSPCTAFRQPPVIGSAFDQQA